MSLPTGFLNEKLTCWLVKYAFSLDLRISVPQGGHIFSCEVSIVHVAELSSLKHGFACRVVAMLRFRSPEVVYSFRDCCD